MSQEMIISVKLLVLLTLAFLAVDHRIAAKCEKRFSCGQFIFKINRTIPFRVRGDPLDCKSKNDLDLQLSCERNRTVLYSGSNSNKYYVVDLAVEIDNFTSWFSTSVLDPGLQENNCSTFPLYSYYADKRDNIRGAGDYHYYDEELIIFVSCKREVRSPRYIDTAPCLTAANQSIYSYVVFGKAEYMVALDIEETCTISRSIKAYFPSLASKIKTGNISFRDIHGAMAQGYLIFWHTTEIPTFYLPQSVGIVLSVMCILPMIAVMWAFAYLIYECRRRHLSIYDGIEDFLQSHSNKLPRYSFKQIKRMTNTFKEKIGEGGYGSVYKGKLPNGQYVAIKILTKSKANGKDFINEVATLGRIHHVNVVRLVGFCATMSKNALVYDYMSNGSLDKFIFGKYPHDTKFNWSKINEIALGVARGMEYLHQGCNMQILHFDIKPHNILLDENFVPKVSDFGLAKLCSMKNNVVTMTTVKGTLGYMAPELFYKRVGEISYKADVYSFGMLLMEMAGRRRNVNANAEQSSQVYFPSWIYDKFEQGQDMEFGSDHFSKEEKGIARKFILIALWCTQMTPTHRPSMKEVLEMLQGDSENLQLPPKPHFYPPNTFVVVEGNTCLDSVDEDEFSESLREYVSIDMNCNN